MPVRSGMHAGEEGIAPGGAALLGVVVGEHRPFVADPVDVGRLADHQAAMVDRRLHPADVVAHDEQDVGLLLLPDQLDAAVERAAFRRVVAGDGLRLAHALRLQAPGRRCRAGPAPPDGVGAGTRQGLVLRRITGRVGVPDDLQAPVRELLHHRRDVVEQRLATPAGSPPGRSRNGCRRGRSGA